ncbi:MAG: metallophosphoesterase [Clostridia bacterium]|nr:metallophosphoesterase [Clostridia bacterium]
MEPKLSFHNGTFKIMQVADTQELSFVSRDTVLLLTMAALLEKPDLVIFTGDQIHGMDPTYRLGSVRDNVARTVGKLTKPFVKADIPFAVTFGNHDCQVGLSNAEQAEIYAGIPGYIAGQRRSDDDPGTFVLPVYGEDGKVACKLFVFDSGAQEADGAYVPVPKARLDYFRETCEGDMPVCVFQHIPVPEFYDVLEKVPKKAPGAVEAFRTHAGEYYVLPQSVKDAGGFMGESPAVPDVNGGEFEALKQNGNVLFLAVGHDHNNSFVAEKDGIKLIYTQGAGFHVYGPGTDRGVRIFELNENDPAAFTTRTVTFESAAGGQLSNPALDLVLTHIPTSVEQVKKIPVVGPAFVDAVNAIGDKLGGKQSVEAPDRASPEDDAQSDFSYETIE